MRTSQIWDIVFVGGGLAAGLMALRLKQVRPEVRALVLERGETLGGNHTWSFHHSDMTPEQIRWLAPLITRTWAKNEVQFPSLSRTLDNPYSAILSETYHEALVEALPGSVETGVEVVRIEARSVNLADGRKISAGCVIDARGILECDPRSVGSLKFLGQDVELAEPHGVKYPVIMDSLCEQKGSFRFFYLLPWTETSLLIEDNRYTLDKKLDREEFRTEIKQYAAKKGWKIERLIREEEGVLPVPLYSGFASFQASEAPAVGIAAGLFHYTTTYSVRHAVSMADDLATLPELTPEAVHELVRSRMATHEKRNHFYLMLNRMLLMGIEPDNAYKVLQRFYGLSPVVIQNFYADRMTPSDRLKLMFGGKPPLPLARAAKLIWNSRGPSTRSSGHVTQKPGPSRRST